MKKVFVLLIFLFTGGAMPAQEKTSITATFNHIALSVSNLDSAAFFYKTFLGLEEIPIPFQATIMRWLSLGEGKELHLIANEKNNIRLNKSVHLALMVDDFAACLRRLTAMKISYGDWQGKANAINKRGDGVQQVYLQDRDGYWIKINDAAATANVQQVKNEIWKLEEDYWRYVKTKDLAAYRNLWDDAFLGYPSTNIIAGKDRITDWITDMYKDLSRQFSYELTRKVENVFDDIVLVLYDATQIWTNAKGDVLEKTTYKLTHTWKKTNQGWRIIGGMGTKK